MPEVRGDFGCEYVNYVGYSPDWVDRAMLDYGDGCPEGKLPSVPVFAVTDDITYQEKIEALSGTMYDYDDVFDNIPDYFDYDEPDDWEELSDLMVRWNVECVVILVNQMSLVAGLASPELGSVTCPIVLCLRRNRILQNLETDRSCLIPTGREKPSLTGPSSVLDSVTSSPTWRTHRNRMIPKLKTDRHKKTDLADDPGGKTESPHSGFGKPITGIILRMFVRVYDGMMMVRSWAVCVCGFDSEFGDVHERVGAGAPGDEIVVSVTMTTTINLFSNLHYIHIIQNTTFN